MKKLVVVGGGGFAKEVIWLAQDCGYEVVGVLDDADNVQNQKVLGIKVLGKISDWKTYAHHEFILAIGSPRTRRIVFKKMIELGSPKFATLIHPNVIASQHITIGEGSIICAGCTLTVEIEIGNHCILNLNITVGHECTIEDFVTVAPMVAISGNVHLKDYSEVGTGAAIRQGIIIEKGAMLGMGGILTKNIPENSIFLGNPAKEFKNLPPIK